MLKRDGEYTCSICGKKFYTYNGGRREMCLVFHPAGTCCHYKEEEVEQTA